MVGEESKARLVYKQDFAKEWSTTIQVLDSGQASLEAPLLAPLHGTPHTPLGDRL